MPEILTVIPEGLELAPPARGARVLLMDPPADLLRDVVAVKERDVGIDPGPGSTRVEGAVGGAQDLLEVSHRRRRAPGRRGSPGRARRRAARARPPRRRRRRARRR